MADITVHTRRDTLSDNSEALDVVLRNGDQDMVIPCFNERCAERLQQALVDAINLHAAAEVALGDELRASAGWAA